MQTPIRMGQLTVHISAQTSIPAQLRYSSSISAWWRYRMEAFSALLAFCAGNSPVTGVFPSQRPMARSFDVSLIYAWINGWVNNREAGGLRRHRAHYYVTVMITFPSLSPEPKIPAASPHKMVKNVSIFDMRLMVLMMPKSAISIRIVCRLSFRRGKAFPMTTIRKAFYSFVRHLCKD